MKLVAKGPWLLWGHLVAMLSNALLGPGWANILKYSLIFVL